MDPKHLDHSFLAAIKGLLKNNEIFYHSGATYSKLTDIGKSAIIDLVEIYAPHLYRAEEELIALRSRDYVFKELKK